MQFSIDRGKLFLGLVFTLLVIIASVFILNTVEAKELTQTVTMEVNPAYQGYFKYGEWLPVWIRLENIGVDLVGEVQVKVVRDFEETTFSVPVSLPAGARKRLPVYVLPNNFTHELRIDFISDEEILSTNNTIVHPQPNINYLIGVAANQRGALTLVPGIQLPGGRLPVPVDISLDQLPDRSEALRSLNSIILNDVDTSTLTPQQINALVGWVQQGGRLVIGGGIGAIQTTSGLPADIIPMLPDDLSELDNLDALGNFAGTVPIRVPGPFVVATGNLPQGKTLVAQDGLPLVREIQIGDGYITFVALDLTSSPFDAWTGTTAFWETLLSPGSAYPNWMPPDMSVQQMTSGPIGNALSNIPSLDLPSARGVAVLLGIYILLVGPINFLVLRWRKKLHWGWITIPVITLSFSAMSFGFGYAKRGSDLIINKIAIIQGGAESGAPVISYIGLFSPANQEYELEVSGDNLLSPVSNYYNPWMSSIPPGENIGNLTFIQGNPSRIRGLNVNQWSMQSFMTETTMADIGPIEANLVLEDQRLVGSVKNNSGYLISDVVLILRPNFIRLGDLADGESIDVDMMLNAGEIHGATMSWKIFENQLNPSAVSPPPRELEFKRMVLEAVLDQQNYYGPRFDPGISRSATELSGSSKITIIGWLDMAPPDVLINGQLPQVTATSLYQTQVSYQIPRKGEIVIPAGLIPGVVAEMPMSAGTCGFENTSIWIEQGEAVMEFILPVETSDIEIDNLQFLVQSDGGWSTPPVIKIYNWEIENWQPIDKTVLGINIISNPASYISPDRLVRFQINPQNQDFRGGSCYYTGLGLKGSR